VAIHGGINITLSKEEQPVDISEGDAKLKSITNAEPESNSEGSRESIAGRS